MTDAEKEAFEHAMNCPARSMGDHDDCTCGLKYRKERDAALAQLEKERRATDALLTSAKEIQEQMRVQNFLIFKPLRGKFFDAIEACEKARTP